jgi:uncharacterized caspase-like protein
MIATTSYLSLRISSVLLSLTLTTTGALAAQEKRVALVIGNAAYQHTSKLANPVNDARDMSAGLRKHGFEVMEGYDLDKRAMETRIRQFVEALAGAQVGLFFYAGHGLQVSGQNYIVPVDAEFKSPSSLDFETIRIDVVQRVMERETRTNLLLLDACRDNPLARNLERALGTRAVNIAKGLAVMEAGEGTLISFSTQPGAAALDGDGRNSPYAEALVRHMLGAQEDDISSILIKVRNDVVKATQRRQVPWEHSALTSRFYFSPPKPPASRSPTFEQQIEISFWESVKASKNPEALQTYLDRFPNGQFASLARVTIAQLKQEAQQQAALTAREAELRAAEEAKRQAEQKREEAERKAREARQTEELRKAHEEARLAREALKEAEHQRETAEKAAKEARVAAAAAQAEREAAVKAEQLRTALPPTPSAPLLTVANLTLTQPARETPFQITLDRAALPERARIRVRGLPAGARFNAGQQSGAVGWLIEPGDIGQLALLMPENEAGTSQLVVEVVTSEGMVISGANAVVEVRANADQRAIINKGDDEHRANKLMKRGEQLLADGDITAARAFFRTAAEAGDAEAALAMGATYDPNLLSQHRVRGMKPDADTAHFWYRRALDLGSKDALDRIDQLARR